MGQSVQRVTASKECLSPVCAMPNNVQGNEVRMGTGVEGAYLPVVWEFNWGSGEEAGNQPVCLLVPVGNQ